MKPILRSLAFTVSAILVCSASSLNAADEPSVPPKSVPSSTPVTPAAGTPEAKSPATSPSGPAVADFDRTTSGSNTEPIKLEALVITESTQLSFQFSIRVTRSQPENQLIAMYVDRVLAGSNAEEVGLHPGAMIVSIEGKPVAQYEASFRSGSELSRILVGRREGDEVTLVVVDPDETRQKKIVVTRHTRMQVRSW